MVWIRLIVFILLTGLPVSSFAIPPKPTHSGDAPWATALPSDRLSEFVSQNGVGGSTLITDTRFGWMWAGQPSLKKMNWYDAWNYCDQSRYGGFEDWRLPSYWQLVSIIDSFRHGRFIYQVFSKVNEDMILWSRDDSISIDQPDWDDRYAYFIKGGLLTFEVRDNEFNALCVRGQDYKSDAPEGGDRFAEVQNDLILDKRTGLYWTSARDARSSRYYMWTVPVEREAAIKYCENLSFAGRNNWRLPNIQELVMILQLDARHPSTRMPKMPSTMNQIWSSDVSPLTGYPWRIHTNAQILASDDRLAVFGCVHE